MVLRATTCFVANQEACSFSQHLDKAFSADPWKRLQAMLHKLAFEVNQCKLMNILR